MTGEQYVKRQMAHLREMLARELVHEETTADRAALEFAIANLWHVENPPTVGELRAARQARV